MTRSVSFDIKANDEASDTLINVGRRISDVEQQLKELDGKRVRIDADTASAQRQLQILEAEARIATGDRKLKVDADVEEVKRKLSGLRDARVKVDADTAAAQAQLAALHQQVDRLDGRRINVKVDADTGSALGKIAAVGLALSAVAPATAFLAGGIASIGLVGAGAFGVLKGSLSGVSDAVTALGETSSSVSSSMESNADAVARATHTVELAQRGVAAAIRAVGDAQMGVTRATEAVTDAQRSQAQAARSVADAQQGVARASEAVTDAQQAQAMAARSVADAQDRVADASRGVKDAETGLADAQRDATRAQEGLNEARKTAAERLDDLERRTKGMRLSEADAALSVVEAEERLNKVRSDPKSTSSERTRAALAVSMAKERQENLSAEAKKLAETKAEADAKGVEGSDEVTAAQERVEQANRGVEQAQRRIADATKAVALAQRGVTDAQAAYERSTRGVRDAQLGVEAATRRVADAQEAYERATRAVRDAQLGVKEATQKVADAQQAVKDRQWDVLDAQKRVTEAAKTGADSAAGGMNKVKDAMAGLTPEGRRFAVFLKELIDGPLKEIRDAGQRNLLPGLQAGIQSMLPYTHQLAASFGGISKSVGDFFAKIGPHMGPAIVQLARFADIAASKAFPDLGDAVSVLLDKFTQWAQGKSAEDVRAGVERIEGVLVKLWEGLQLAGKGFQYLADNSGQIAVVSGAMLVLRGAVVAVNVAMAANPIGLVVAAIAALGIATYGLYQKNETFRESVNSLWSALKDGFSKAWAVLKPHLEALGKTIQAELIPAFNDFIKAIEPLVSYVSTVMWPVISRVFGQIVDSIRNSIRILTGILKVFTGLLTGDWQKVWDGLGQIVVAAMANVGAVLNTALAGVLTKVGEILQKVPGMGAIADQLLTTASAIKDAQTKLEGAGTATQNFGDKTKTATEKARDFAKAQQDAADRTNALRDSLLAGEASEDSFWASVNKATTSVKDNGKTLDKHTEAGRANRQSLRDIVQSSNDLIKKHGENGASQKTLTTTYNNGRTELIRVATQMGMTKQEATNYANANLHTVKPNVEKATKAIQDGKKPVDTLAEAHKTGGKAADTAGTASSRSADAHSTAWTKIKTTALVPIRFVVNDVFGGLVKAYNALAAKFPGVPTLPVPKASFATGGEVRGPGTGTSDDIPINVSNREWIIRAAAAKKLGPDVMQMINQADRLDLTGDPGTGAIVRRGFASGGEVSADQISRMNSVRSWIPSVDPLPYVWGGVGPSGYDCSGLVGEVWARLTGRSSYRRYMTTNTILDSPGSLGLASGPGLFSIGVSRTHTAGNLAGLGFEAASTASGIKVGSSAKSYSSFPSVYHLASFGTSGAGDGGGVFDPVAYVKSAAKAAINKLTGGWFQKLAGMGALGELGVGATKKIISAFDSGGFLQPGMNLAYNGTGTPEPVLTSSQWDGVTHAAGVNPDRYRGGGDYHVHVEVKNAVVGNEQQLTRTIASAVNSAVATGTIKFDAMRR